MGSIKSHWRQAAFFLAVLWAPSGFAQVSASIKGTVTDPTGATVPSSAVTAKNLETGSARRAVTDESGRFILLLLPVGEYEVRAAKPGFQDAVRSGIRLAVGQEATVDLTLPVSAAKSDVLVSGDAPVVSTTTTDISGLVGERQVKDLPLNGRSYD